MTDTAIRDAIAKVWELTDNAETDAKIAAQSLDVLRSLVVAQDLNSGNTDKLDIDAFSTFTEGIKVLICQIADQCGSAAKLANNLGRNVRASTK